MEDYDPSSPGWMRPDELADEQDLALYDRDMARKPLQRSRLVGYLAETKTMAQQLSYGGHAEASQAARNLSRELNKELDRLSRKPDASTHRSNASPGAQSGRRILTHEAFQRAKLMPTGVIVNVDLPTKKATAHRPSCDYLSAEHFDTKVIQNKGRNGGYYYFASFDDARRARGASPCTVCLAGS